MQAIHVQFIVDAGLPGSDLKDVIKRAEAEVAKFSYPGYTFRFKHIYADAAERHSYLEGGALGYPYHVIAIGTPNEET